jgi:YrbI family 3-deoxy-D-manno-octulosonate 8-phosphate phosphatase
LNSKTLKSVERPKIIITDFDGCLTDDRVWLNKWGQEFVAANRKDGLAVNRLKKLGILTVIASTEKNKVVKARGKKMGVEVLQGLSDKAKAIDEYLIKNKLAWEDSWYIGNDVNDLGAISKAMFSICPSDAVEIVINTVDYVLKTKGGFGILSEIVTELEKTN